MHERRIGVLLGGLSNERLVSLESGQSVLSALIERGHDAHHVFVDRDVDLVLRLEQIDVAFIALHGRYGEDGCIQGLLETLGIPYTGSDVLSSALAMNKLRAKQIFRLSNLPTPPYYAAPARIDADELLARHGDFGYPAVVKPVSEGSSIGVARVDSADELVAAFQRAARFDDLVLVERFIDGQEVSVAVLGDRVLGAAELDTSARAGFCDHESKYGGSRGTALLMPPRLGAERLRGIVHQAAMAHRALGCSGATQVDFIVSPTGNEYLLEVNTVPGLTRQSLVPRIAHAAGVPFEELVERMLHGAELRAARPRTAGRLQRSFMLTSPEA